MDAFTEALAVVPMVHLPVVPGQRVLLLGPGAGSAADVILRYPDIATVAVIGDSVSAAAAKDRRVVMAPSLDQVPPSFGASLSIVAVPALNDALMAGVYARHLPGAGIAVFAIANPTQVKQLKDLVKRSWPFVQPYRENVPPSVNAPAGPAWFLLAGDQGFKRARPMPGWTSRLTDKYLPALFTLAKDEYGAAFGA
jgi:hypothetical protein